MIRAHTADEVQAEFLAHLRHLARYWANLPDKTPLERTEGLTHSILITLDGSGFLPSFDLVLRPHPDDKDFDISEDQNYYEDGMVINADCHLHSIFFKVPA